MPAKLRATLLLSIALLAGCEEKSPTAPPVTVQVASVEITAETDTLTALDATTRLTAVAKDASGAVVSNVSITWTSATPQVLTVTGGTSGTAEARAIGRGSAQVTAATGGVTGSKELHVAQRVATVRIAPSTWDAGWIGARQQFTATAADANGHEVPGVTGFAWTSTNEPVTRIDASGLAIAAAAGSAEVKAEVMTKVGSAAVTVLNGGSGGLASGVAYSVWFGRTDDAPAVLVDGSLQVFGGVYPDARNPVDPVWSQPNVAKFQFWRDRIGLLTDVHGGVGTLRVRDRVGEWVTLATGNARDFALEGDHIAVLHDDGSFRVKSGVHGAWTTLATGGVRTFVLEGNRIAVLFDSGLLRAKDGIHGAWADLSTGVRDVVLAGNRIGVVKDDGSAYVKDGLHAPWSAIAASGLRKLALGGQAIVMLREDGSVGAKEGINGPVWPMAGSNVVDVAAEATSSGYRIAWLRDDGTLSGKDGVTAAVTPLGTSIDAFQLQGDYIGALSGRVLRLKIGLFGAVQTATVAGAGPIQQFRPVVDVPHTPNRTTPASYQTKQGECAAHTGGVHCIGKIEYGPFYVAPHYGRFCGAGRPDDWTAALVAGPIDGMDALCRHHDSGKTWYPEDTTVAQSCIVYYGLYYARLTRDGTLLAQGSDFYDNKAKWNSAWGTMMPNLKEAVEIYFDWVDSGPIAGCNLSKFEDLTRGRHS